jgi:hypothetical protein
MHLLVYLNKAIAGGCFWKLSKTSHRFTSQFSTTAYREMDLSIRNLNSLPSTQGYPLRPIPRLQYNPNTRYKIDSILERVGANNTHQRSTILDKARDEMSWICRQQENQQGYTASK